MSRSEELLGYFAAAVDAISAALAYELSAARSEIMRK
jgi:hypothetical protein